MVGRVFQDSLGLVRDHTKREDTRERIIEDGPQKRTLSTPSLDDIHTLAGGEEIELDKKTETLTQGEQPEQRPNSPGGSGDPVIYEDEESES